MSYREVLSQAYSLTIRNPLLWLFGLVMLGGFNLSLINFFSFVQGDEWHRMPFLVQNFVSSSIAAPAVMLCAGIVAFFILNLVKIIFISIVHNLLHTKQNNECNLCVQIKAQSGDAKVPLPYFTWLMRVLAASAVTIGLTVGITIAANIILAASEYNNPVAVMMNILLVGIMACVIGTWNAFTSYFIVLHGLNFETASAAAIDLIVKRARRVAEFVIIISLIYSVSVLISHSFIQLWQDGFNQLDVIIKLMLLVVSVLWLAINNVFFSAAFLVFFDRTVKSTPVEQKVPQPAPLA